MQKVIGISDKITDEEELLNTSIATAGHCAFGSCKTSVRVIGFSCATCAKHFCAGHKYAETHGCRLEFEKGTVFQSYFLEDFKGFVNFSEFSKKIW